MRVLQTPGAAPLAEAPPWHAARRATTSVPRDAWLAAALITMAALVVLAVVRHVPVGRYPADFVAILNGGYRIAQGQWPHVDFAVPHGAWPLVQGWVALKLTPWLVPFVTYQVTQWLTVLPMAAYVAAAQPTRLPAFGILGIAAVASLVPYVMEAENAAGLSYYAGYNRLTTALLFVSFIWAMTPRRVTWADVFVTAALLLALLATKITGFVVGAGVFAAAAMLSPVKRKILVRTGGVLFTVLAILQLATDLPLAYLADIRAMLAINQGGLAYFAASTTLKSLPGLIALGALTIALSPRKWGPWWYIPTTALSRPVLYRRSMRAPILIAIVAAGTLLAESQNTGSLLLVAATAVLFAPLPRNRATPVLLSGCKVAVAVSILAPWLGNTLYRGLLIATREVPSLSIDPAVAKLIPGGAVDSSTAAIAADLARLWKLPDPPAALFTGSTSTQSADFVALARSVNDASVEARRRGLIGAEVRVITVSSVDLFARLLDAKSPKGTNLWQTPGRTFAPRTLEGMQTYLGAVDAAFMRTCQVDSADMQLNRMFRPALEKDFMQSELTPCWSVWTRQPTRLRPNQGSNAPD